MATALDILQSYWGYPAFRPPQDLVIASVLAGKDTLALLPTGGGKSICFQVPALVRPGVCVVVSPLIALMKDQVTQLGKRNIPAAAIFSGMYYKDIDRILDNAVNDYLKVLYVSPERLKTELFLERFKRMPVNLIAVDEAHCISQWGYDFRPPYLEIADIRQWHPKAPVLAVTATATPEVVKDIQERLAFAKEHVFQIPFTRDNLAYVVMQEENKHQKVLDILKGVKGASVIYVRNRKKTKETALQLRSLGISADYYHAGLAPDVRSARQDAWIDGKTRVMVATNAFGMGIDKADVRSVIHLDLPDSLEAYFQEAGRAGRDGEKAYAVLLYEEADKEKLLRSYELAFPSFDEVKRVYAALGNFFQLATGSGKDESFDFDLMTFSEAFKIHPAVAHSCLTTLEKEGWLTLSDGYHVPARFQVMVSKEQLYDFMLKRPQYEKLVKALLRTHLGAFSAPVNIKEDRLAKFLKMDEEQLRKHWTYLQQEGILEYQPSKNKPQITFLEERLDTNNLTFDYQRRAFLMERTKYRIDQAILYATSKECRSLQLVRYLGQPNPVKCGVCDVCLEQKKETALSNDVQQRYASKIQDLLQREPLTTKQLLDSFHPRHQAIISTMIEWLLDEGWMEMKNETYRWLKT